MLVFNSKGHLVPNSNILSTLEELKNEFVEKIPSTTRKELFDRLTDYCRALKLACNGSNLLFWIDGSFTTKAPTPGDIDLVCFINHDIAEAINTSLDLFKFPNSVDNFGIDAYLVKIYPNNHPKYPLFIGDRLYWMSQFDTTKRNRAGNKYPKGFLEIDY